MSLYSVIVIGLSFLISLFFCLFIKKNLLDILGAFLVPIILLLGDVFLSQNEFGFAILNLIFGICYCLLGSIAGIFLGRYLREKVFKTNA